MEETYLSVDQIARALAMHPKTIQRYIRNGKLPAKKIGRSWLVTGHDLSVFTEKPFSPLRLEAPAAVPVPGGTDRVTATVELSVAGREQAEDIINMLNAALNSKTLEYGRASMHTQYQEGEHLLHVTMWGGLLFVHTMLHFLYSFTQAGREE
jgi:excisionase family DNA binding protein